MDTQDIFEASDQEKKALSRKRIFYVIVALDIAMAILILWEIVELFLL